MVSALICTHAELEGELKQARVLQVRIDQLSERVAQKRHALYASELFARTASALDPHFWGDAFRALPIEVNRARDWFFQGFALIDQVDKDLAVDLELFSRGGLEILKAIEHQGYAVLGRRPAISKSRKLWLVARAAMGKLF